MVLPLLVWLAALVGGAACWAFRWNERRLHVALALSTGTFLGAVFLHLLPEVASRDAAWSHRHDEPQAVTAEHMAAAADHEDHEDHADVEHGAVARGDDHEQEAGHAHGSSTLWLCVLLGVLGVHLIEAVFLRTTERQGVSRHRSVSLMTIVGVSVHASSAGLALSALSTGGALRVPFAAAFLTHKAFESFAMVNVFLLAHYSRARIAVILGLFALLTPAFMLAGDSLFSGAGHDVIDGVTALAAGTFLYVCVAELLPEVFHHRGDNLVKFVFLLAGLALSAVFVEFGA